MRFANLALITFALCATTASDGWAGGKMVRCRVTSGGSVVVDGPCRFSPDTDGSFALENKNRQKPLFDEILVVSVSMVGQGAAEVRGLTKDGVNSRWGEAKRSAQDPACWDGEDFRVCAY